MDPQLRALRVNTVELRRQPGTRRTVEVDVDPAVLGVDDVRAAGREVHVDLVAESTVDGIVVSGRIDVAWDDECRRCLRALDLRGEAIVDELYQEEVTDPDAFAIGTDALDLSSLVRDAVWLVLADPPPLCSDDCAGICPVCGADRNETVCDCDTEVRDDRWSVLDQVQTDD